jgi:hypothetical protein
MSDWTWESPQLWVTLVAVALGCGAWVWVTWLRTRPEPCRHRWEQQGELGQVMRCGIVSTNYAILKCSECGDVIQKVL